MRPYLLDPVRVRGNSDPEEIFRKVYVMRMMALGFAIGMAAVSCGAVDAVAQTTAAPAGSMAATAPGGTVGQAGARNRLEAIRSGNAIAVPRGKRYRSMRRAR